MACTDVPGVRLLAKGAMLVALLALFGSAALVRNAAAAEKQTRYSLAGGCYALQAPDGRFVVKAGQGYSASARSKSRAEQFRMQAATLGRYLFYGADRDFMALDGQGISSAGEPTNDADWTVRKGGGAFTITNEFADRQLAVGDGGELVTVAAGSAGGAGRFGFKRASGCAVFPEAELNVVGPPLKGSPRYSEVAGFLDAHNHLMAFELAGGSLHCGRPWHPYGIARALVDCPDHQPNGEAAVVENTFKHGVPVGTHDTDGWPTFAGWPAHDSLTHEQVYYRWIERAWRGGLRIFVNLLVDQGAVCDVYPIRRNPCDEMNTIRLELKHTYELQDYIDAQHGGPGKGWFRIVRNPFQARKVIQRGKLAVVLGIETSELFGCIHMNDEPRCSREQIDDQLNEFHRLGVRQMELINKLDNSFGGVAFDSGPIGVVANLGNKYKTGSFFSIEQCQGDEHDKPQLGVPGSEQGSVFSAALQAFLPPGQTPIYPEPPHCNTRGLTGLGEYLVRRMMRKGMITDPDHLSVLARNQLLSLLESRRYSGVISSHSWSTPGAFPRIDRLGGVITPISSNSDHFVEEWRGLRSLRDRRHYFGLGFGADSNGFHKQPAPRNGTVKYPFKSFDGGVTIKRQRSGTRTYDVNADGVAHYGLYPDWVEDLRKLAGPKIVRDMSRGAEAYLQMWERATGIPAPRCAGWAKQRFTASGLGRRLALGASPKATLRRAGQPLRRHRVWRWCTEAKGRNVTASFGPGAQTVLLLSGLHRNRAGGIGPGASASKLRGRANALGRGVWTAPTGRGRSFVYLVSGGQVSHAGVAAASLAGDSARLSQAVRRAAR